jgi:hypothetical protein
MQDTSNELAKPSSRRPRRVAGFLTVFRDFHKAFRQSAAHARTFPPRLWLLTALGRVPDRHMASCTSSVRFKGKGSDPQL